MYLRIVTSRDDKLTEAQQAVLIASGLITVQTRIVEFVDSPKTADRLLSPGPGLGGHPTVYEIHDGCVFSADELQKLAVAINSGPNKIRIIRWIQEDDFEELLLLPAYWGGRPPTTLVNDCGAPALVDFD